VPSTELRSRIIRAARSIVVKLGTNVLAGDDGTLAPARINAIAEQIAVLRRQGHDITVVTSGAIGAGVAQAQLPHRPKELPGLQAAAAIGQPALMSLYNRALTKHGLHAAQILVTRSDFESRQRYLNIRNTINALHNLSAIPLINENDTVAVEEIRFGENDIIAAQVANLLRADLMILLSVVDGLLDEQGNVVDFVPAVTDDVLRMAHQRRSAMGTGGMITKLQAARLVTQAGEAAMIANGRTKDILVRILGGEKVGTVFAPAEHKLSARQRWIGMTVRPAGLIRVDDGAAAALRRGGKSLLASGIMAVEGEFARGDVVDVLDAKDTRIARGKTNYAADELARIKGLRTTHIEQVLGEKPFDEVIHRDNLVLLAN
jgi:glutamate 5-kinase